MSASTTLEIDLSEEFPHLVCAPIVEAVIHWRARSEVSLQPQLEKLKSRLPDYPSTHGQHELQFKSELSPEGAAHSQTAQWHGFRFESSNSRNIVQFTRNGLVFSRIAPYQDWNRFATEAKHLWRIYCEMTQPPEIERLGVRFINRIVPADLDKLDEVLTLPPRSFNLPALPIGEFLHRSLFQVPGHPFGLSVIQASQPPSPPDTNLPGLILDIDVFTTTTIDIDEATVSLRLDEMHWLKNKAFFSLLTRKEIERLKDLKP